MAYFQMARNRTNGGMFLIWEYCLGIKSEFWSPAEAHGDYNSSKKKNLKLVEHLERNPYKTLKYSRGPQHKRWLRVGLDSTGVTKQY